MRGGFVLSNVRSILPKAIGDSIEEGVLAFGKKLHGFDREDALLSGIESRTSSPVRITRSKEGLSNIEGIYHRRGLQICRRHHFCCDGWDQGGRVHL